MEGNLVEYATRLFESCRIAASVEEWEDYEVIDLVYSLIVDRILHENFIEDLCDRIKVAKKVALDLKFYEEIDNDSEI